MRTQHSKPARRFGAVMKAVTVIRIGVFLAFSYSVPGGAAPIFDDRIMTTAPKVAGQAKLLLLQDERNIHHVRIDYLRSVAEARTRIAGVSGITATPALVIESKPSGYVIPPYGGNVGSNLPHLVNSAVAVGKNVGRQTGDWNATVDAASTAFGVMRASLIRGAKKFFPDPIMGIRG